MTKGHVAGNQPMPIDVEAGKAAKVDGAKCPKGLGYAIAELENPMRILTATVSAEGLDLKLVPVRTDGPIPKKELFRAMEAIGAMKVGRPVKALDVLDGNFLGLGVKLVATRGCGEDKK